MANVYYSVGQNTTDHKIGSPTITISGDTATFSVAQTSDYFCIGDRITHAGGDGLCYAKEKVDTTHWKVCTKLGANPTGVTTQSVTSIAHEYTSLSAAESGASDSNHLNTLDLVTGGYVLFFPCCYDSGADNETYIQGWTTGINNYIKVFTPYLITSQCNKSQRHTGKWTTTAYKIEVNTTGGMLRPYESYVKVEGLQLRNLNGDPDVSIYGSSDTKELWVSHCIIDRSTVTTGVSRGLYWSTAPANAKLYMWNNIFSNVAGGTNQADGILIKNANITAYLYNNTITNVQYGIYVDSSAVVIAKNNIVINASIHTYYNAGSWGSGSTNNASSEDYVDVPITNKIILSSSSVTNYFISTSDSHIDSSATYAVELQGVAIDLSSDTYVPFSDDIESDTRSDPWDIGASIADEPNDVYYSVGQNTTDHKTGSPNITIASGVATFSVAQTSDNMCVGDRVTHVGGDTLCYLKSKTSTTVWNVITKLGANPTNVTGQSVTSIAHEYTTLSAAESGSSDSNHLNTLNLGPYRLFLSCCYDSGTDTTLVVIDGWTTGADNYIKVFTPYNTSTQCNKSQRHDGKWNTTAYNMIGSPSGETGIIQVKDNYIWIEGIQIRNTDTDGNGIQIRDILTIANAEIKVSHCLVDGNNAYDVADTRYGVFFYTINAPNTVTKVWNNIIYNFATKGYGIRAAYGTQTMYAYNNTVTGCNKGIAVSNSVDVSGIVKNNTVIGTDPFYSEGLATFDTGNSNNNATNPADAVGSSPVTLSSSTLTDYFVSTSDFHINSSATYADEIIGDAANLSSDTYLPFDDDIDNVVRTGDWDIGADQHAGITITGTSVITLPMLTAASTGKRESTGTSIITLPMLTSISAGTRISIGTSVLTLTMLTTTGIGKRKSTGTSTLTLPIIMSAGTGTRISTGTSTLVLPMLQSSSSGVRVSVGTSSLILPILTSQGSGAFVHVGTSIIILPMLTAAGTGKRISTGTSILDLPLLISSASGVRTSVGSSALILPSLTTIASGARKSVGTSILTLPILTTEAIGIRKSIGTSVLILPLLTTTGSGSLVHVGSSILNLPMLISTSSGALKHTGISAITLPILTTDASGQLIHIGTSALVLPFLETQGTGVFVHIGTSALTLPILTTSASGDIGVYKEVLNLDSRITQVRSLDSRITAVLILDSKLNGLIT